MREGGKVDRKWRGRKKERMGASIETTYYEILAERVCVAQPDFVIAPFGRRMFREAGDHVFAGRLFGRAIIT